MSSNKKIVLRKTVKMLSILNNNNTNNKISLFTQPHTQIHIDINKKQH